MQEEEAKPWYLSKGFLGPLVTALLMALSGFGVIELEPQSVSAAVYQVLELAGVLVGAYGRAAARQPLRML